MGGLKMGDRGLSVGRQGEVCNLQLVPSCHYQNIALQLAMKRHTRAVQLRTVRACSMSPSLVYLHFLLHLP